jgi:polar amino acid transport system substrate-binding protein
MKFLICILIIFFSMSLSADQLTMTTDPWPPLVFEHQAAEGKGIMADIALRAFEIAGHQVKLVIMPWTRAVKSVEEGSMDVLLGAAKNHEREKVMLYPGNEVVANRTVFYVLSGSDWEYHGVESLKDRNLGVVADYEYPDLKQWMEANPSQVNKIAGDGALIRLIKMMKSDRVNTILDNYQVIEYQASRLKMSPEIKRAGVLSTTLGYAAISRKNPKAQIYADQFDQAIETMKKNGNMAAIFRKYGVKPWN